MAAESRTSNNNYTSIAFSIVFMKTKLKEHYKDVAKELGEHITMVTANSATKLEKIYLKCDWYNKKILINKKPYLSEPGAYLAFEEELRKFGWKISTRLCFSKKTPNLV
jgi:hypothetical protein